MEGRQVFLFLQFGSDLTHLHAKDSALYDTVLADVAHHFLHNTCRHSKTVARIGTGLRGDGGVDSHQFAARVDQRTAGVAGVDGCVGLDERLNLHLGVEDIDVTRLGGHDTRRDGRSEVERIADGEHPFADTQVIGVAHEDHRQPCLFDFQERDIRVRVSADQRSRVFAFVVEDHLNLVSTVDDVVVGDDIAVLGDDDTRTGRLLRRHFALLSRAAEEELKKVHLLRGDLVAVGRLDVDYRIDGQLGCLSEIRLSCLRQRSKTAVGNRDSGGII